MIRLIRSVFILIYFIFLHLQSIYAIEIPKNIYLDIENLDSKRSELICLALNDYFEARGENYPARLAVAKVVINRSLDKRFPSDICDVIRHTRSRHLHRCQFSWYCDGRSDKPYNRKAWEKSLKMAAAVLHRDSSIYDPTNGALWYHANFVKPYWSNKLSVTSVVGGHIFYSDINKVRRSKNKLEVKLIIPNQARPILWAELSKLREINITSR